MYDTRPDVPLATKRPGEDEGERNTFLIHLQVVMGVSHIGTV